MRELSVGDKVRVRSDLINCTQYDGVYFVGVMNSMSGKECEVTQIKGDNRYYINGDTQYAWSSEMFEEDPTQDAVNTPSHYLHGGIETIEVIRMMLTPEEFRGYCKGNIIKYRERAVYKGNMEEDYAKALKYKEFMEVEDELQTR